MVRTIWKWPLAVTDEQAIEMPVGSHILTVRNQYERPTLWALVNPEEEELEYRILRTVGTGHNCSDLEDPYDYLGTYQLSNGQLVFHVFTKAG